MPEYGGVARIGARFFRGATEDTESARETEEAFAPAMFTSQPAKVTRGYGLTLNLGNYESARFDVVIEMPCYPEDVDLCDEWCKAWAEKRAVHEASQVRGGKTASEKKKSGAF